MRAPMRRLVRRPGEPATPRRATTAFAARIAGSVVGVAGITLMGAGTFGNPGSVFAAGNHNGPVVSDFTCAADQECLHPAQVPTTGDQAGCTAIAGLLKVDALDSSDSYWHFIVPASELFEFNGTTFDTNFSGGTSETVTFVQQQKDGGYMGVVVEADGGVTLNWASVPESAIMDESSEAEGTGAENSDGNGDFTLSGSCAGDGTTSSTTSSSTTSSTNQTTSSQTTSSTTSSQSSTSTNSSTSSTSTSSSTSSTGNTTSTADTSSSSNTTSSTSTSSDTSSSSSTSQTTVVTDPSTSTSTSSQVSSSSSSATPSTGVLGASTTTPSTGADVEFGLGITLLLGGAGVMIATTRINRNKRR